MVESEKGKCWLVVRLVPLDTNEVKWKWHIGLWCELTKLSTMIDWCLSRINIGGSLLWSYALSRYYTFISTGPFHCTHWFSSWSKRRALYLKLDYKTSRLHKLVIILSKASVKHMDKNMKRKYVSSFPSVLISSVALVFIIVACLVRGSKCRLQLTFSSAASDDMGITYFGYMYSF